MLLLGTHHLILEGAGGCSRGTAPNPALSPGHRDAVDVPALAHPQHSCRFVCAVSSHHSPASLSLPQAEMFHGGANLTILVKLEPGTPGAPVTAAERKEQQELLAGLSWGLPRGAEQPPRAVPCPQGRGWGQWHRAVGSSLALGPVPWLKLSGVPSLALCRVQPLPYTQGLWKGRRGAQRGHGVKAKVGLRDTEGGRGGG